MGCRLVVERGDGLGWIEVGRPFLSTTNTSDDLTRGPRGEVRWESGEDDVPAMISPTIFLSTPLSSIPRFNNSYNKLSEDVSRKAPFLARVRAVLLAYYGIIPRRNQLDVIVSYMSEPDCLIERQNKMPGGCLILEIEEEWGLTVMTTSSGLFCRSATRSRRTLDVLKVRARAALMVSGAVAAVVVLAASRLRSIVRRFLRFSQTAWSCFVCIFANVQVVEVRNTTFEVRNRGK